MDSELNGRWLKSDGDPPPQQGMYQVKRTSESNDFVWSYWNGERFNWRASNFKSAIENRRKQSPQGDFPLWLEGSFIPIEETTWVENKIEGRRFISAPQPKRLLLCV